MNDPKAVNRQSEVKTIWQSGWCSVGGNPEKFQALVGKGADGFHAGLAKWTGSETTVAWGPAGSDEKSAKMIAQAATSEALGRTSPAKQFGGIPHIEPTTRGRSR